jgi:hypothetical protein
MATPADLCFAVWSLFGLILCAYLFLYVFSHFIVLAKHVSVSLLALIGFATLISVGPRELAVHVDSRARALFVDYVLAYSPLQSSWEGIQSFASSSELSPAFVAGKAAVSSAFSYFAGTAHTVSE